MLVTSGGVNLHRRDRGAVPTVPTLSDTGRQKFLVFLAFLGLAVGLILVEELPCAGAGLDCALGVLTVYPALDRKSVV